ncbi:acetyl-CoA C-acetyltransferase [Lactobacillus sp. 3B(2020)]|uniref:thiolase family protein n=1 Tax=Lactobacillus sp. 3B(2020) TaxID=2695882 RepID=UPI0015DDB4FD|nr:acetyl-CoA C-acetyltransferase [Lactobacillus sp. 3B(2020)]QLL69980.1 acetyl-CoA C-acyltransferase [Lactobacillus sp. 3B(2020)]
MQRVAIVGAARTPIGKMGGLLASLSAVELGTIAIQAALDRAQIEPTVVNEVYMGMAIQAGQGQNPARQAAMHAGLPETVPAMTVNVLCGSGMQAISLAAKQILLGDAKIMVAGGMESMSNAPYLLKKGRFGYRFGNSELIDSLSQDGLTDAFYHYPMGMTAENLLERYPVSRKELDAFALQSQQRAIKATQSGRFKDEIIPVTVKTKKKTFVVSEDEPIRETSMAALAKLKPVFKENGDVTAGNSSGINDGAAAVVLMDAEMAEKEGYPILGYWIDGNLVGVDPAIMGIGPLQATNKLMKKHALQTNDLDLVEVNEAFAAQSVVTIRELGLNPDIVNVNGGAIALGHPLGDSGARIIVTLLYEMQKRQSKLGLASLCIGGGMGAATLIERTK